MKKLGKPKRAIISKASRIRTEYSMRNYGYSAHALSWVLNVPNSRVIAWIKRGWLPNRRGPDGRLYQIFENEIIEFMKKHPEAYDAKKMNINLMGA